MIDLSKPFIHFSNFVEADIAICISRSRVQRRCYPLSFLPYYALFVVLHLWIAFSWGLAWRNDYPFVRKLADWSISSTLKEFIWGAQATICERSMVFMSFDLLSSQRKETRKQLICLDASLTIIKGRPINLSYDARSLAIFSSFKTLPNNQWAEIQLLTKDTE